jgi:hypothetical protein
VILIDESEYISDSKGLLFKIAQILIFRNWHFLDPIAKMLKVSDQNRGRYIQVNGRTFFESTFRVSTLLLHNINK